MVICAIIVIRNEWSLGDINHDADSSLPPQSCSSFRFRRNRGRGNLRALDLGSRKRGTLFSRKELHAELSRGCMVVAVRLCEAGSTLRRHCRNLRILLGHSERDDSLGPVHGLRYPRNVGRHGRIPSASPYAEPALLGLPGDDAHCALRGHRVRSCVHQGSTHPRRKVDHVTACKEGKTRLFFAGGFCFCGPTENRTPTSSMPWTRSTTEL